MYLCAYVSLCVCVYVYCLCIFWSFNLRGHFLTDLMSVAYINLQVNNVMLCKLWWYNSSNFYHYRLIVSNITVSLWRADHVGGLLEISLFESPRLHVMVGFVEWGYHVSDVIMCQIWNNFGLINVCCQYFESTF